MSHVERIVIILALLTGLLALGVGCGESAETESQSALPSSSGQTVAAADLDLDLDLPEPAPEPEPSAEVEAPAQETGDTLSAPTPELFEVDGVRLRRMALTRAVEDREPIDPAMAFPAEERPLYVFFDVENQTDEDAEIIVTFERPDGERVGHVSLEIPAHAPRWRTWALSRMVTAPGSWTAEARTADGALLGRIPFDIEG